MNTFTVTVSELNSGNCEIWIASSDDELMEMLGYSLSYTQQDPISERRSLYAAQVCALVDTVIDEDLGSYEAAEMLWGCVYEMEEHEGYRFVISFNYID